MRTQKSNIVRFWHLVELFSTQKVDRPDPRNRQRPVISWREGGPLPWETMAPPASRGKARLVWQHTVYLGVYAVENIYEHLHAAFPRDEDAYEERPGGLSACAALVVDQDGLYVADSAVLSSALWGIGRTINPGVSTPGWFEGFETADSRLRESLDEYLADAHNDRDEEEPPLGSPDIRQFLTLAAEASGIQGQERLRTDIVHIASVAVREDRAKDLPGFDFLNSFHLNDLRRVADADTWGSALDAYLTPDHALPVGHRIDVRRNPEHLVAGTTVDQMPRGRWLSDPEHPLSTSQQFAVNQALSMDVANVSLLGVNGPPGTGKTTMLRDILAGNVTDRAGALARLDRPDEAFSSRVHEWKAAGYPRKVKQLREEIAGYEIVVASSNNAAVANVSDELPLRENIHETWHSVDYLADLATEIGRRTGDDSEPPSRWGVVAARLGNAANRNAFESSFWFGRTTPARDQPNPSDEAAVLGIQQRLKDWEVDPASRPSWSAARAAFLEAHSHLQTILADRCDAARRIARAAEVRVEIEGRRGAARHAQESADIASRDLAAARLELTKVEQALAMARDRYERHLHVRPRWWESLISMGGATKDWRQALAPMTQVLGATEAELVDATSRVSHLTNEGSRWQASQADAEVSLRALQFEQAGLDALKEPDRLRYGRTYPGTLWQDDDHERELHGAWLDPEVNEARSDLFRTALEVHLAFLANATGARQCLMGSLDVMAGRAPADLDPDARLAAWQFLFMVVPLVSTTFASVPSMLKGLEPEALGWLLIDEAGQATPQEAVGAIWRARRVVVVGDPMQLTPVITVPPKAQHDLAKQFDLSETWIPCHSSVQHLADRIGRHGTTLHIGDRPLWVSSPLRVHRRCDSPMFEISNQIAYEGLMINGVHSRGAGHLEAAPASQWFDVPATQPGTHLQAEQIRCLRDQLTRLLDAGIHAEDVIAISPFRSIANELEELKDTFPGITAGTVHTAQGREADIVFLVLGGDPRKPGAKRWASSTPNLVNVAVSRAKRRLYLIGDQEAWARYPYFDTTAAQLSGAQRQDPFVRGERLEAP
jgi:hypothetical protein